MFDLQTEPAPPGLAPLGQVVELRELPYGVMREAMAASDKPSEHAERLLGAALHIDGVPITYAGLRDLPGRFTQDIMEAIEQVMRMHGLRRGASAADAEGPKA